MSSGIGKVMMKAVVSNLDLRSRLSAHSDVVQMRHGANATIVGRQCVERPTLSLSFIDTYCYFPYLCTKYPYISMDSFLSVQGRFSPQCFAPDTEVRHLVTFIYLVLTYYLVASELG